MPQPQPPASSPAHPDVAKVLFRSAWMSVILGIALQLVALGIGLCFGKTPAVSNFVTDLTQKVSWSVLVCVGLAVGSAAARAAPIATGLIGLLAAPAAFAVAKLVHKAVAEMLKVGLAPDVAPTAALLAGIKAAQYGVFGVLLARLGRVPGAGLRTHAAGGLLIGAAGAAIVLALMIAGAEKQPPALALTARGINEVLFPVGCAVVFFMTNRWGKLSPAR